MCDDFSGLDFGDGAMGEVFGHDVGRSDGMRDDEVGINDGVDSRTGWTNLEGMVSIEEGEGVHNMEGGVIGKDSNNYDQIYPCIQED